MRPEKTKTAIYKIKEMPQEARPQERLIEQGPDCLRASELLAIIIRTGYKGEDVLELSQRILSEYGSKAIIKERNVIRLMQELGIPKVKASQIAACFELGRRFFKEDAGRMPTIRGADDVSDYLKDMRKMKKEAHNHPSEQEEPSEYDKQVTGKLKSAGELLGIPLIDHVIIAGQSYFSFKEKGMMQQ